jgi:tetratricopeptide (TPR) repeat protein
MVHRTKGEKEKAIHHFRTALAIASPPKWDNEPFWNHYHLAGLFSNEGEFDDANGHVELAKSYAVDDLYNMGRTMHMQADVCRQQDRLEDAKPEALHALKIFEKLGAANDAGNSKDLLQQIERAMESGSASSQW